MTKVATIGFFDGMHLGHRFLLQELRSIAQQEALTPVVVTFRQHPRSVLHSDYIPELLMTPEERLAAIHAQGIEDVAMMDFAAVQTWTRRQFLAFLRDELEVEVLLMGYNHRFGSDGIADLADYQQVAAEEHIRLLQAKPYAEGKVFVSSTKIRSLLLAHKVEQANTLLAAPYSLTGEVVHGRQIGRSIGFPTANLQLHNIAKLVPPAGVYAVEVTVEGRSYKGILNIGTNPTVGGQAQSLEVYIHDFSGDLYGQWLTVRFLHFLRGEQCFSSLEALRQQIKTDCAEAWDEDTTI